MVTFECARTMQLAPDNKSSFVAADVKSLSPELRRYLGASPMIETQNTAIHKAAKDVGANAKTAWERVEALYDWMRTKVQYENGSESKGAAAALKNGKANHDDMSALFVALCRDADVPARLVWVPEFCYAEFYLLDKNGEGHWLPCSPAGAKAFGEMPDTKLILAKGDNFRAPEVHDRQRYIRTYLNAHPGTLRRRQAVGAMGGAADIELSAANTAISDFLGEAASDVPPRQGYFSSLLFVVFRPHMDLAIGAVCRSGSACRSWAIWGRWRPTATLRRRPAPS